jgi:hypothetical protein
MIKFGLTLIFKLNLNIEILNKKLNNIKMPQFIYIGSTELERDNNLFKIGKTKQDIQKRIKQYQTGRSELTKFILLDFFPCNDCGYIEYLLKIKLKNFHHKNEIYKIDYNKLKSIIEETIELEDITDDETSYNEDSDNTSDSDYVPDSEVEDTIKIKRKVKEDLLFEKDHLEQVIEYLFNRIDSDLELYFKTKRNKFYYKTNILKNVNELEDISKNLKRNILNIFRTNSLDHYEEEERIEQINNKEDEFNYEIKEAEIENDNSFLLIKIIISLLITFIGISYYFIFYY